MLKENFIKKFYPKNYVCHAFDHLQRVHKFAMNIAKTEKSVNYKILDAAAWFHDLARPLESQGKCKCHAEHGAKIVIPILKKLKFSENEIKQVSEAIAVHRYSTGKKAESIEAKILQDADRLDAIGAISVARIFSYGGREGRSIENGVKRFYFKQIKLKPSTFITKTAKKIAERKYNLTKLFLKEIEEDLR